MGTMPLADVRQAGTGGPLMFFQLYVFKDREFVKRLVQRELCFPLGDMHLLFVTK